MDGKFFLRIVLGVLIERWWAVLLVVLGSVLVISGVYGLATKSILVEKDDYCECIPPEEIIPLCNQEVEELQTAIQERDEAYDALGHWCRDLEWKIQVFETDERLRIKSNF